jgi:hypothetical protein
LERRERLTAYFPYAIPTALSSDQLRWRGRDQHRRGDLVKPERFASFCSSSVSLGRTGGRRRIRKGRATIDGDRVLRDRRERYEDEHNDRRIR